MCPFLSFKDLFRAGLYKKEEERQNIWRKPAGDTLSVETMPEQFLHHQFAVLPLKSFHVSSPCVFCNKRVGKVSSFFSCSHTYPSTCVFRNRRRI